jgi:hypothetical protein
VDMARRIPTLAGTTNLAETMNMGHLGMEGGLKIPPTDPLNVEGRTMVRPEAGMKVLLGTLRATEGMRRLLGLRD